MSLILHIIVTYIKENIITKLQKLYSPPRNPRAGNKSVVVFVKKPLCTGDLLPACKILIERPEKCNLTTFYANAMTQTQNYHNNRNKELFVF